MKKVFAFLMFLLFYFGLFAGEQPVVAVYHFENETAPKKFPDNTLRNIEEKLRSELIKTQRFEVMSADIMEAAIARHKAESYNLNRDRKYQIELGRKISARYIVIGKVRYDGDNYYTIFIEMIDTKRETSAGAGNADFINSKDSRDRAVNNIVTQLLDSSKKHLESSPQQQSCDASPRTFPCKDSKTGYMWSQRTKEKMNYDAAVSYCSNLNEGGYSDWHLPSVGELKTISRNGSSKFGDVESFYSSTQWYVQGYGQGRTGHWDFDFSSGDGNRYYDETTLYVRCVRW